jgi:activating signal cointegrator 1
MKSLTISQPYASLIADGKKIVENRTWNTNYRGPLAIHAGKGSQYLTKSELARYPTGCIVAVADLTACLRLDGIIDSNHARPIAGSRYTIGEILSHSYTEGPYCWILENVVALPTPIPCKGAQGLWVPDESTRKALEELRR